MKRNPKAIFVLILFALATILARWYARRAGDPFEYEKYTQITAKQNVRQPYVRGKLVVMNSAPGWANGGVLEELQAALPEVYRRNDRMKSGQQFSLKSTSVAMVVVT